MPTPDGPVMTNTRATAGNPNAAARGKPRRLAVSSEISSERWRSESPPIVLLGAMRQWARILLTFTRPYFGTASSMSKTFAVSTYSGGFSSSEWIEQAPRLEVALELSALDSDLVGPCERVHSLVQGSLWGH